MIALLLNKFKSLLLGALDLLGSILCCRKNMKHQSGIPLHRSDSSSKLINDDGGTTWEDDDWDSCEVVVDKPNIPQTTSDHIAAYRQHVAVARQASATEEKEIEPDLFSDMAPSIKKQKKIFVGKDNLKSARESTFCPEYRSYQYHGG